MAGLCRDIFNQKFNVQPAVSEGKPFPAIEGCSSAWHEVWAVIQDSRMKFDDGDTSCLKEAGVCEFVVGAVRHHDYMLEGSCCKELRGRSVLTRG